MWQKWAPAAYAAGGALLAGAAAGAAYYKREELTASYTWATDHMKYVGTLWDEAALKRRVDTLFKIETSMGVLFRNFHTSLPANPPAFKDARTFIILPKPSSSYASHFLPAQNGLASDEISAHTGMFDAKTNDGYYELGLMTAQLLRDVIISIRTVREDVKPNETKGDAPKVRSASPKEDVEETAQTESLSTSEKGASEEESPLAEKSPRKYQHRSRKRW
ncbi:hypothetical protein QCA50_000376 [Cerrena zonata]|uniref:Uncharacterized protein n=1 Tax=Cerrena zonata TaxID=2478898 RepID=A0AAW0GZN7_9APHY